MNKKISIFSIISVFLVIAIIVAITSCKKLKMEVAYEPVKSEIKSNPPYLRVFIENSGSMDGYMCNGSQLKDAIYDYVSDLNKFVKSADLNYINSQIIPYHGGLTSYIKDLNPSSFRMAGGDTSSSDLGSIIGNVLSTVNDSTVSIFVSDCILDLPSKDAVKFLTNCEIRIKNEVISAQKRVPNLGIEILKLSSDFSGKYFYPNGEVEMLTDVKRPYYIWIMGDKNYLAKLNSEIPLSMLDKYGLEGSVSFSNASAIPFEIQNRGLTGNVIIPTGRGDYQATVLADFRSTLQPDVAIQEKTNYNFNNPNLTIESISPITAKDSKFTHVINFTILKGITVPDECLTLKMPDLPVWINQSNDESGVNVQKNLSKTTGIKYLIQGIADAYKTEEVSGRMKFNLKTK